MAKILNLLFDWLATAFDKVPFLSKVKSYRTVIGISLYGATLLPQAKALAAITVMTTETGAYSALDLAQAAIIVFTGLALNSKGRPQLGNGGK